MTKIAIIGSGRNGVFVDIAAVVNMLSIIEDIKHYIEPIISDFVEYVEPTEYRYSVKENNTSDLAWPVLVKHFDKLELHI